MSKVNDINNITLPVYKRLQKEVQEKFDDNAVLQRFDKVYVDELPADVQAWLDAHFVDADRKIKLEAKELNDYQWANFTSYCESLGSSTLIGTGCSYGNQGNLYARANYSSKVFVLDLSSSDYIHLEDNKFVKGSGSSAPDYPFVNTLQLNLSTTYYNDAKKAIILDLLSNSGYTTVDSSNTVNSKIRSLVLGTKLYRHLIRYKLKSNVPDSFKFIVTQLSDSSTYEIGELPPGDYQSVISISDTVLTSLAGNGGTNLLPASIRYNVSFSAGVTGFSTQVNIVLLIHINLSSSPALYIDLISITDGYSLAFPSGTGYSSEVTSDTVTEL